MARAVHLKKLEFDTACPLFHELTPPEKKIISIENRECRAGEQDGLLSL